MSQVVLLVRSMLAAFVHGTCRRVRMPVLEPRKRDVYCARRVSLRALVRVRLYAAGFVSLAITLPAPCAAAQGAPSPSDGKVPNASGFLQDYARLKPAPEKDGRYAWMAADNELRQYTRFILPPMERPRFTPLDIVPIKAAFNLVRAAAGSSAQVARVSAEIECEDSVSHKLLIEAVITGVGERKFIEGQPITWPEVEPVLASWAQDFKVRLNAVQGR